MDDGDVINEQQAGQEAPRVAVRAQAKREELLERIAGAVWEEGTVEPLKGLSLSRISTPLRPLHGVLEPSLCVIAQGSKEVVLGDARYVYDPAHYLLATVGLPSVGRVLAASKERPCLGLRLELPSALVSSGMVEAGHASPSSPRGRAPRLSDVRAIDVSPLDTNLLDAVVRLVRLLVGEQGSTLRHLATLGGYTPDIVRAVERLRQDFDQPLRIEQIARELGMSVSGFHHFKAVTAMSPMQFQKQLRLQEALRLMLGENLEASSAASRVRYHDASHFNREYRTVFGVPPMRNIQRLR